MSRNPRKYLPDDRYCEYVYPPDHVRAGERCRAVKMRGSKYCYYHQPDKEKVLKQLAEARENIGKRNVKHGIYSKTGRKCDNCSLADVCKYYEKGKNVCDFDLNPNVDLASLESIRKFVEELVQSEMKRYRKLEPYFMVDGDINMELHDLSSRVAKRLSAVLKDYSAIMGEYQKRRKISGWKDVLLS